MESEMKDWKVNWFFPQDLESDSEEALAFLRCLDNLEFDEVSSGEDLESVMLELHNLEK